MKIYLTGANGRLGQTVLHLLPDAIPLVRETKGLRHEKITDFSSPALRTLLADADAVIHLAGSMNFLDANEMWDTNVELTRKLVAATPAKARFVFASSISVYGKKLAEIPANEETRTHPDSPYAKSKLEAERLVLATNKNAVILRIGTVYGKGFEDYYQILGLIERGKMSVFGDGKNRISFVHVDDVAKTIAAAVKATSKPGVYVIAGESMPQKEIYALAAGKLGVPRPHRHINVPFALFFTWLEETKAKIKKSKPRLTGEHVHILASDRVFDCSKAKRALGFNPRPIETGISEMVAELKERKN